MPIQHHPLSQEFPEFKQEIHELKMKDAHFSRLYDEYDVVDKEVTRLEIEGMPVADETLTEKKKKRLLIKDELYTLLRLSCVGA